MPFNTPIGNAVVATNGAAKIQYYTYTEMAALIGGGGSGSVTSISAADNSIILSPSPIVSTGSVKVNPRITMMYVSLNIA